MTTNPYQGRYPYLACRQGIWREIARFVSRDSPRTECLLELGAGYCDFVNQFPARKKIAFDLNPQMTEFAAEDVVLRIDNAIFLRGVDEASVDLVFASNFLEHLTQPELEVLLPNIRRVLKPEGRLILIQPNHRLCPEDYFCDETHRTIFSDGHMAEFLGNHGLRLVKLIPAVLPFSLTSRLPKWPMLVRLYLLSPIKPFARQMYVVATRS